MHQGQILRIPSSICRCRSWLGARKVRWAAVWSAPTTGAGRKRLARFGADPTHNRAALDGIAASWAGRRA